MPGRPLVAPDCVPERHGVRTRCGRQPDGSKPSPQGVNALADGLEVNVW
jgi:hypothetical protein